MYTNPWRLPEARIESTFVKQSLDTLGGACPKLLFHLVRISLEQALHPPL